MSVGRGGGRQSWGVVVWYTQRWELTQETGCKVRCRAIFLREVEPQSGAG